MELIMNDELVEISSLDVTNESGLYYDTTTTFDDICEENVLEDDIENWSLDEFSKSFPKDLYDPYKDEIYSLSIIYDNMQLVWKVAYSNLFKYLLVVENEDLLEALKELKDKREEYIIENHLS